MEDVVNRQEILRHHTGGGFLLTRHVSQRLGSVFSVIGARYGWRPAAVTMSGLAVSLASSASVAVLGGGAAAGVVAFLGWQLAYALDCADGQLARATLRTSKAGGALDLYTDWLGRVGVVAALVHLAAADVNVPGWAVVLLTMGLLAGIFHEAMDDHHPVVQATGPGTLRELTGIVRDAPFLYTVYAAAVVAGSPWILVALALGAVLGAAQFLVRFARITAAAWRE